MAVLIPVFKEREEKEDYEGFGREFDEAPKTVLLGKRESYKKKEALQEDASLEIKKALRRSIHREELAEPYMKEIGNALTSQELYLRINELTSPLLPVYQLFEKRGEAINNTVDYSVGL